MSTLIARASVALLAALVVIVAADDARQLPGRVFAGENPSASPAPSATPDWSPPVDMLPASGSEMTSGFVAPAVAATVAPVPAATAAPAPTPAPQPTVAPVPVRQPAPTRTVAPTAAPTIVPAASCPADWFCYPRLAVAGPIVPYTDCGGSTDIGTSIRAFTCLSPGYLMGHAYTQFGKVTQWQAGDVVYAYGRSFTVTGAVTARSCDPPVLPLAPLSMQTSLSPSSCGAVLVVQAR